jgi:hypothetical protein
MEAALALAMYGLFYGRHPNAGLLIGVSGIIIGVVALISSSGTVGIGLGVVNIAQGVLLIVKWWNRRRRDRAPRALGNKGRAIIAVLTGRMRDAAPESV